MTEKARGMTTIDKRAFINLPAEIRLNIYAHTLSHITALSIDKPDALTHPSLPWLSTPELEVRFDVRHGEETKALLMMMRSSKRVLLEVLELALRTKIIRCWNWDGLLRLRERVGAEMVSKIKHLDLFLYRMESSETRIVKVVDGLWAIVRCGSGLQFVSDERRGDLVDFIAGCRALETFRLDIDDHPIAIAGSSATAQSWRDGCQEMHEWFKPLVDAVRSFKSIKLVSFEERPLRHMALLVRQAHWASRVRQVTSSRQGEEPARI